MSKKQKIDVKAIRQKMGLSIEGMASKLGVSWRTVQRWESGGEPSKTNLARLKRIERKIEKEKGEISSDEEISSSNKNNKEKCPSCFGKIKDNKCQDCGAIKVQDGKYVPPENIKRKENKGGEVRMEEKKEKEENENRYVWSSKILHSYICGCGEEVEVEENIQTSFWTGVEWVICPNCGERRRKENLIKEAIRYGK